MMDVRDYEGCETMRDYEGLYKYCVTFQDFVVLPT